MQPTILSIQSWVSTGHVGNAAAMFPLQRLGAEVWGVHTVQFSNHPGHGGFTGQVFPGEATRALIDGIEARGLFRGATRCCPAIWAMRRQGMRCCMRSGGCDRRTSTRCTVAIR